MSESIKGSHVSLTNENISQVTPEKANGERIGYFGKIAFANSATRREAKALMFEELAVATRNGMPLDEAIESSLRTERQRTGKVRKIFGTTPWEFVQSATALAYIILSATGALFLMLLTSAWAANVEHVGVVLAGRLLPLIRQGHPLSVAMSMLPRDYTKQEVNIVRAGESWGNLPGALENLGRFQYYEREIQRHWARMVYPLWLCYFMLSIVQFCVIFILPKYADIFAQIQMDMPPMTQFFIDATGLFTYAGIGIIVPLTWIFVGIFTARLYLVGNRVLRDCCIGVAIAIAVFAVVSLAQMLSNNYANINTLELTIGIIVAIICAVFLSNPILKLIEGIVISSEKLWSRLFGNLPIFGAPRLTELESRWLSALSLGLGSGSESHKAVRMAGQICGGWIATCSDHAAQLIENGHSIGDAVAESCVLRLPYRNRLRLLDGRQCYLEGLAAIAEDASRDSFNTMNRAARICEVLSVCMIGVFVGVFACAMYFPLFQIPLEFGIGN